MTTFDVEYLTRPLSDTPRSAFVITLAETRADLHAARRLRHEVFVDEQRLFDRDGRVSSTGFDGDIETTEETHRCRH